MPEFLFLIKRDSHTVVSCEFCEIYEITFFTEYLRTTASESLSRGQPSHWSKHIKFEILKNPSRKSCREKKAIFQYYLWWPIAAIEKKLSKSRVEKKSWIQWPWIQWTSQLTFTCLKSTIETIENGVEYVQS